MRLATALFLLLVSTPVLATSAEPPRRLMVLHHGDEHVAETHLVDALRLYTRDLGCEISLATAATAPSGDWPALPPADAADFALWLDTSAGPQTLEAVRLAASERHRLTAPDDGGESRFSAFAMKVRALVARPPKPALPPAAVPPEPAAKPEESVPPVEPTPAVPLPPVIAAAAAPIAPPPAAPPPPSFPSWQVDLRGGLNVEPERLLPVLTLRVTRALVGPFALALEGAWRPDDDARTSAGPVDLFDLPIGLAGLWRTELGGFALSTGPRVRGHLVTVTGTSNGRHGAATRGVLGLGAIGTLSRPLFAGLALQATLAAEVVTPRLAVTLDGAPVAATGGANLEAALGVAWSWP
jgi:hypothetical protein